MLRGTGQARSVVSCQHGALLLQAAPYTAGGRTFTFDEPCDYFTYGKAKASTLSLSVLVAIEMFNAMNALSEVRPSSCLLLVDLSTLLAGS